MSVALAGPHAKNIGLMQFNAFRWEAVKGAYLIRREEECFMDITKWDPFGGELSSFRRQVDRLFDSFFGREPAFWPRERNLPPIDVVETAEEVVIKAELPDMEEKDVSLSLSGENLIIKGERKGEKEEKDKHFHRMERWCGIFERVVPLPVSVDEEKISAHYRKGVLEIHLHKKPEVKPRHIPITVK
jgi:HSP20 family protein